jgi:hypothetical protein
MPTLPLGANRMRYVEMPNPAGAATKIHYIDTPVSTLRQRLAERNAKLPPHNFHIDPETFHGFVSLFEVPSNDEGAELVVVRALNDHHSASGQQNRYG